MKKTKKMQKKMLISRVFFFYHSFKGKAVSIMSSKVKSNREIEEKQRRHITVTFEFLLIQFKSVACLPKHLTLLVSTTIIAFKDVGMVFHGPQ